MYNACLLLFASFGHRYSEPDSEVRHRSVAPAFRLVGALVLLLERSEHEQEAEEAQEEEGRKRSEVPAPTEIVVGRRVSQQSSTYKLPSCRICM